MNTTITQNTNLDLDDLPDVSFLPQLIQNLFKIRGQFVSIKSRRLAKVKKNIVDVIEKESVFNVRVGCSYEKLANVKLQRELGIEPSPRSWGSYVPGFYPYLISHDKDGETNYYFHFTSINGNDNCVPKVTWLRNGTEITPEEAKIYCLAAEFPKTKEERDCFDMNVNHILEINGKPV